MTYPEDFISSLTSVCKMIRLRYEEKRKWEKRNKV